MRARVHLLQYGCGRGQPADLVFSFYHMGLGDWSQVVRLAGRCLYLLGHSASPRCFSIWFQFAQFSFPVQWGEGIDSDIPTIELSGCSGRVLWNDWLTESSQHPKALWEALGSLSSYTDQETEAQSLHKCLKAQSINERKQDLKLGSISAMLHFTASWGMIDTFQCSIDNRIVCSIFRWGKVLHREENGWFDSSVISNTFVCLTGLVLKASALFLINSSYI